MPLRVKRFSVRLLLQSLFPFTRSCRKYYSFSTLHRTEIIDVSVQLKLDSNTDTFRPRGESYFTAVWYPFESEFSTSLRFIFLFLKLLPCSVTVQIIDNKWSDFGCIVQCFVTFQTSAFHWTVAIESAVDSSFFWGYLVTQVPGGFLASMYPANRWEL